MLYCCVVWDQSSSLTFYGVSWRHEYGVTDGTCREGTYRTIENAVNPRGGGDGWKRRGWWEGGFFTSLGSLPSVLPFAFCFFAVYLFFHSHNWGVLCVPYPARSAGSRWRAAGRSALHLRHRDPPRVARERCVCQSAPRFLRRDLRQRLFS